MRRYQLHAVSETPSRFCLSRSRLAILQKTSARMHLMFDDGYECIYKSLLELKDNRKLRLTVFPVVSEIGGKNIWDSNGALAGTPLLSWDQLLSLKKAGVDIGSHGLTHRDLRMLPENDLHRELQVSKDTLEQKLGCLVKGFCYPYGLYNKRCIESLERSGYEWAVTTSPSLLTGLHDPYRQRRIELNGNDNNLTLLCKLYGFMDATYLLSDLRLFVEKGSIIFKRFFIREK